MPDLEFLACMLKLTGDNLMTAGPIQLQDQNDKQVYFIVCTCHDTADNGLQD
jgi:hypothetical protein